MEFLKFSKYKQQLIAFCRKIIYTEFTEQKGGSRDGETTEEVNSQQ